MTSHSRLFFFSPPPPAVTGFRRIICDGSTKVSPPACSPKEKEKKITSVSNPLVKHCVKLRLSSSYRRSSRSLLVVGLTPILEICKYQKDDGHDLSLIDCLVMLEGAQAPDIFPDLYEDLVFVSPNVMKKLSGLQSIESTQAICIMKMPTSFYDLEENNCDETTFSSLLPSPYRLLVLDGIQDPGNLGTLMRSARAFKWVDWASNNFDLVSCYYD